MSIWKLRYALPVVLLSATLALAPGCPVTPPIEPVQIRKGPYLTYPGNNTGMTVLWQTEQTPQTAKVMWGSTSECLDGSATVSESGSDTDGHQFSYTITGLTPDSLVYYQVVVDNQPHPSTFRTAPRTDANSLTFYAYGDTRTNPESHEEVVSRLLADMDADLSSRQTLCLHAGDFVAHGMEESCWDSQFFDPNYTYIQTLLSRVPLMGAIGNHELYYSNYHKPDPNSDGKLFRKYWPYVFLTSTPPFYYSFDYGPLHVSVIDTYTTSYKAGSAQLTWLDNDLASSSKTWKIALFHKPLWCASKPDSSTKEARDALCPIFENRGVKVVVQGHEHYYSRVSYKGVEYLTLGGGGAPLVPPVASEPNVVMSDEVYHFGRFDIAGNTMDVTIINEEESTIDAFTVNSGS